MSEQPVKPGYKRTEVGVIPEEWDVLPFGELANIRNQKIAPKNVHPDTPCVDLEHIGQGNGALIGHLLASDATSTKYQFRRGDVLFGRLRAYLRKYWFATFDGICTTEIWPLAAREGKSTSRYLLYLVQTPRFIETAGVTYGTHMPRTDWSVIRSLSVPRPPLPEQHVIAAALADVDALLAALDRLIAKQRAIKQGALQDLLTGRVRLPGFARKPGYKKTELGVVPEDWEVRSLNEVGSFSKGRGIRRDDIVDDGAPCIRYGEIYTTYNDYVIDVASRIPFDVAAQSQEIRKGDLLFTGSGETADEIGKCVAYLGEGIVYAGGDIIILSPHRDDSLFLGFLLNSAVATEQKSSLGQGDAVVHISTANLGKVRVPLPPIPEQRAITAVLSDMDAEIAALERRRAKTQALKQGMMQELLTGRIRLVKPSSLL